MSTAIQDRETIARFLKDPEGSFAVFIESEFVALPQRHMERDAPILSIELIEPRIARDPESAGPILTAGPDSAAAQAEGVVALVREALHGACHGIEAIQPVSGGQPQAAFTILADVPDSATGLGGIRRVEPVVHERLGDRIVPID